LVDSYSKWVEAELVSSTNGESSVKVLRRLFATHGIPRILVSDNGSGFAGETFKEFLAKNGIRHVFSAPYHPASNGQAEIMVKKIKNSLKLMKKGDTETQLRRILFKDHITPSSSTGSAPSELLFGRRLRSALTLLRPELPPRTRACVSVPEKPTRAFRIGDPVLARNFGRGEHWLHGTVIEVKGNTDYLVQLESGVSVHRHVDQMKFHHTRTDTALELDDDNEPAVVEAPDERVEASMQLNEPSSVDPSVSDNGGPASVTEAVDNETAAAAPDPTAVIADTPTAEVRRSGRVRRANVRLKDYVW